MSSFAKSFLILRRLRPQVVLGFGGAVTACPLVWAFLHRIPRGVYQADAILGRANRQLLPLVNVIAHGFRKTWGLFPQRKSLWVGIPVRQSIMPLAYTPSVGDAPFHLLVIGGSQGAKILSDVLPQAIALLPVLLRQRLRVVQQCRKDLLEETAAAYRSVEVAVTLATFIQEIGTEIAAAHLVVARAGASTIGELACIGRPALFIPYPHALQNHQMENARQVCEGEAGWLIPEDQFTPEALAERLTSLMDDPKLLKNAACKARNVNDRDAVARLTEVAEKLLGMRKQQI